MFQSKLNQAICSVLIILGLVSCTPKHEVEGPKERLTEYISKSFSIKRPEEKQELIKFLTGDVKNRLEGWSQDQFQEAFINSKREFIKLSFKEVKEVSPTEVQITYEIIYRDQGKSLEGKPRLMKVTNKKLAQLVKEQNHWMISDVKNMKELVEYQNELALP